MFQNTNVVFLNTFNAILNIMDANVCVPSVEFIYSVVNYIWKLIIEKFRLESNDQNNLVWFNYLNTYCYIWHPPCIYFNINV